MLRRVFQNAVAKILLLIELIFSLIILSNLSEVMERYYVSETNRVTGNSYKYTQCVEIEYTKAEDKGSSEVDKDLKRHLSLLFERLESIGGNVYIYPIAGGIDDGTKVLYTVYFSAEEKLATPTENGHNEWDEQGVFVGNANKAYVEKNGTIDVFYDNLKVIDILTTTGYEMNEYIYLKYSDLSEYSQEEVVTGLSYNADFMPFIVFFQSDYVTSEQFLDNITGFLNDYECFDYETVISEETEEDVLTITEYDNVFRMTKYALMILAILMCTGLLFQTILIILQNEKNNIFVMKTYGMKLVMIFKKLLMQMLVILAAAICMALLIEVLVYRMILHYDMLAILKNMLISSAGIAVLFVGICGIAFIRFNSKNMAEVLTREEG